MMTTGGVKPFFTCCLMTLVWFITGSTPTHAQTASWQRELATLPVAQVAFSTPDTDWLVAAAGQYRAQVARGASDDELVLHNGLVRRVFKLSPNAATIAVDNLMTGQSLLRSVRPEAAVQIDGRQANVGGLVGQPNHAYLKREWVDDLHAEPQSATFVGFEIGKPVERLKWGRKRHHAPDAKWPPEGVALRLDFALTGLDNKVRLATISVHYELYDDAPVFMKWMTVSNQTSEPIMLDRFRLEELAVVEEASWVEARDGVAIPSPTSLHVETDFAFGGFNFENANRHIVHWRIDPLFETQVNYLKQTPCLLVIEPTYGPAQKIAPGETFTSCHAFELVYDSSDRERRGLALRQMYRLVAPWVTENPLMHHMRIADPARVKEAIDQAAEVGFEMIILSFGSGFDMDNESPEYLAQWRDVADYAHAKGIELGSYSLLSSRGAPAGNMIVSPAGQTPTHGQCPALTSPWGQEYLARLRRFFAKTGFDLLEHDGSYPGDVDVTARPPLQQGEQDSRWVQWRLISDYYASCREKGIYLNVPDYYFLAGSNKCGMGYREVNWSLPREMQVIHTRQNIYDGTWRKTPSMGWMFVPLSEYHGGGAAATIEPLREHLDHYERMIVANLALGTQACYRGPRLYDSEETKSLVRHWVDWFKQYRDILESDVVHGRRADGRDLDWMLHVNPQLETCGMLVVFNPLDHPVKRELRVNLYYTGLTGRAQVESETGEMTVLELDREYEVVIPVEVPAGGMSWRVISAGGD